MLLRATRFVALTAIFAALLCPFSAARAAETDPALLQAERTLRAAEARPTDARALELYALASRQAEAILARNPDSAGANFVFFAARGRVLMADGFTRNLMTLRSLDRQYLDRAIQLDPNHADALAAKGGILLDLPTLIGGDPAAGLRLLEKASRLNPGGAGTRVSLAKALARNGDTAEARRQAAIGAHRACVLGRRKALDEAVAVLEELDGSVVRAGFR